MGKKGFTPLEAIGRQQKAKRPLTGFTLMEIIVSVFILSLVMAGFADVFFFGKRNIVMSRSKIQAGELGKLFLAPLQMDVTMSERSLGAHNGWGQANNCLTSNGTIPPCPAAQTIDGISYTPSYQIGNVTDPSLQLRKVTVTITWPKPSS